MTFDGGGSSGGGAVTAHTHTNAAGDGGSLTDVTLLNSRQLMSYIYMNSEPSN